MRSIRSKNICSEIKRLWKNAINKPAQTKTNKALLLLKASMARRERVEKIKTLEKVKNSPIPISTYPIVKRVLCFVVFEIKITYRTHTSEINKYHARTFG